MHRVYTNYYCGVCFGLENHFGQLSRFLLSNDVAVLAILLKCHNSPMMKRFHCSGDHKKKCCMFCEEQWNRVAAINLLLVNEKLKDDINDERSIKAKLGKVVLNKRIQKAIDSYPQMADAIAAGYVEMYRLETEKSGIRPIEEAFADMMINAISDVRSLEEWEVLFIRYISRWIYYMDALDDYEDDWKKGRSNALRKEDAPDFYTYTQKYMEEISSDLRYIYRDLGTILEQMPKDTTENSLIFTLAGSDIPYTTARVLSGRRLSKLKIGSIWEGTEKHR
jgi:hypothetical protein